MTTEFRLTRGLSFVCNTCGGSGKIEIDRPGDHRIRNVLRVFCAPCDVAAIGADAHRMIRELSRAHTQEQGRRMSRGLPIEATGEVSLPGWPFSLLIGDP